jgi:hypothetical protein
LSGAAYRQAQIDAHQMTVREQGIMPEEMYHPKIVRSFPSQFGNPRYDKARNTWGID